MLNIDNLRIIIFIEAWEPYVGGGQMHTKQLIHRLIKDYGFNVTLITRKLIIDGNKYEKNYNMYDNKLQVIRCGITSEYSSIIGKISWIINGVFISKGNNYDLIHAMPSLGAIPGKVLSILKNIPIVFSVHGSSYHNKARSINILRMLSNLVLYYMQVKVKYDALITDSSRILSSNIKSKTYVIRNGVNTNDFMRNKKILNDGIFRVLSVGRLSEQKGFYYLIKAMERIVKKVNTIKLFIIGSGKEKDNLYKLVRELKLNEHILFLGKKNYNELLKEYFQSDLFVLPSIFEGQPLTLLEAWASKLPVLVTDCGENNKMVKNGLNGWIVPIKSADALAEKILVAMSMTDKDLMKIGFNGYKEVEKYYSWDRTVNKIYDVYLNTIKSYNVN